MNLGLLDPRQWLLAAAFAGACFLGINFWEHRLVARGDTAGYARAQGEFAKARELLTQAAAAKTLNLQTAKDQATKDKTDAISTLRAQHAVALERLRNRPERPAAGDLPPVAGDGSPAAGCTGAQLYRPDGSVLAGESLRAETIRIELKSCYAQYDRAQSLTN